MPNVAFVTYQASPGINDDDRLAADELRRHGIDVAAAVWDDQAIDWTHFDCVVIRSAWDYHLKPDAYSHWLSRLQDSGVRLWNRPKIVLENLNKRYLTHLTERGVEVVPTRYLPAGDRAMLRDVLESCGWHQAVIKPAVSASAMGTWTTSLASAAADQHQFAAQLKRQDMLVQPYMPEVASLGEWSLMYFDGRYSHAVLKRPASGDFRVHREYGGHAAPAEPSRSLIEQAQAILAGIDGPLLYARVDGIERAGRFVLMELEINEPFLFLGFSAGAAERLAEAIERKLLSKPCRQAAP